MKKEKFTLPTGVETYALTPDEGKELVRIADGSIFREEIVLAYIHYLNGELLPEPHLEVPEDYEERDLTEDKEDEPEFVEPIPEPEEPQMPTSYLDEYEYKELTEKYIRQRYSISEEFAVLRQRDTKPDDFQQYYDYCEECKAKAKEEATHNYI